MTTAKRGGFTIPFGVWRTKLLDGAWCAYCEVPTGPDTTGERIDPERFHTRDAAQARADALNRAAP